VKTRSLIKRPLAVCLSDLFKPRSDEMTVFEYLIKQEEQDRDFTFGVGKNHSLYISYAGYKHMNLFKVREKLQKTYKLKFDFTQGLEEFDSHCGRTFCYFKDVYKEVA
jgi:hypothetical protein